MRIARKSTAIHAVLLTLVSAGLLSAHAPGPVSRTEGAAITAEAAESVSLEESPALENDCALSSKAVPAVPASLDSSRPGPGPAMRPIGNCEKALADCMNKGGDPDTCWNAYWRCSG